MKLEQQVVSLDLAKRLKELGVRQESLVVWVNSNPAKWELRILNSNELQTVPLDEPNTYSAFTVAELGEMLPKGYVTGRSKAEDSEKCFCRPDVGGKKLDHLTIADTEADARAKMLIYLLEKNLIS